MNVKFVAPAVLVKSIAVSKKFYEHILGQKIEMDNGEHVSFEGDSPYGRETMPSR